MTIKVISAQGYNTSTDAYVKIEVEDGSPSSVCCMLLLTAAH